MIANSLTFMNGYTIGNVVVNVFKVYHIDRIWFTYHSRTTRLFNSEIKWTYFCLFGTNVYDVMMFFTVFSKLIL